VLVFPREQDEVAGDDIERLRAIDEPHLAAAFSEEMEEHHVLGPARRALTLAGPNFARMHQGAVNSALR